jgi:hypothetical protein
MLLNFPFFEKKVKKSKKSKKKGTTHFPDVYEQVRPFKAYTTGTNLANQLFLEPIASPPPCYLCLPKEA